jgi:hypothetical protein
MTVTIDRRFRGPPDSANGGYACGAVARLLGTASAEITLRSPPPLDRPLAVQRDGDRASLLDETTLVAEGRVADPGVSPPAALSFADAERASQGYAGFTDHIFPGCFVCGPEREDGLRIFPGPIAGLVAGPWRPDASIADADGAVTLECVWAALDCPSYFGFFAGREAQRALLGRLTARLDARPRVGEACVLAGWSLGQEKRKLHAASALFSEERGLLAIARATWILI